MMKGMPKPRRVLCGMGIVEAKVVRVEGDRCRAMCGHLGKHREHIGLWDEREKPIGVSFCLVAS